MTKDLPVPIDPQALRVVACKNPFKQGHEELFLPPGISLWQVLQEAEPGITPHGAHVWVNDDYIRPRNWASTYPAPGSNITIRAIPQGGWGRMLGMIFVAIAMIVTTALTYGALAPLWGATWAGIFAGIAGMAVGVAGRLALNALFPPAPPGRMAQLSGQSQESPTLSLTGASNSANKWGPIPLVLGRHRAFPPYGANPYTEIQGNDQYLRLLFVWGFGPVEVRNLKIGDNALDSFYGIEVEHRNLTLVLEDQNIAIDVVAKTLTRSSGSWLVNGQPDPPTPGEPPSPPSPPPAFGGERERIEPGMTVTLGGCTTPANDTDYLIDEVTELVLYYSTSTATTTEAGNGNQTVSITFGDEDLTLFSQDVEETTLSILLEQGVPQERTTGAGIQEISVDITWPQGLYSINANGQRIVKAWTGTIEYRRHGEENLTVAIDVVAKTLTRSSGSWIDAGVKVGQTITLDNCTTPANDTTYLISEVTALILTYTTSTATTTEVGNGNQTYWIMAHSITGDQRIRAATASAVRRGWRWRVNTANDPTASFDVRLIRLEPAGSPQQISFSYWTAIRDINYTEAWDPPVACAVTAMRIKASDQLSGVVDTFSGIVHSICLDWDAGSATWISRTTNNPASLYRHLVQGTHKQKTLANSRLSLTALQDWHEFCTTNGFAYNKIIDYPARQKEVLDEIAAAGRAAFSWLDNLLSVIIDRPQTFTIGPAWTPRNSANFKSAIVYPDLPHCFRVPFRNEDNDWAEDERLVLADGYALLDGSGVRRNAWNNVATKNLSGAAVNVGGGVVGLPCTAHGFTAGWTVEVAGTTNYDGSYVVQDTSTVNQIHIIAAYVAETFGSGDTASLPLATIYEQLELPGQTHPDNIFKLARYFLAVARIRFESHQWDADLLQLVATRGDRIKFAHDVLLVGLSWGRVKELLLEEIGGVPTGNLAGVVVDEWCPMTLGGSYGVRFVLPDNSHVLEAVDTVVGTENLELTFTTPIIPEDDWPAVGDLFLFGETGLESIDLLVHSILPKTDLQATIKAVVYDENIYLADAGTIPPHNPGFTIPAEWWTPIVDWVRSGQSVLYQDPTGGWQSRILVTFRQVGAISEYIRGLQAKFWREDSYVSSRIITKVVPLEEGEISLMPVEDGVEYNFQLRYIKTDNTVGPWTEVQTHTVEGRTYTPEPPDPANLKIVNNGVTPTKKLDISFSSCAVMSDAGLMYPVPGQDLTLDIEAAGVNGLDTGSGAADTCYHLFVIADPALELFGTLASLSPTAPTMPAGYTHKKLVSSLFTRSVLPFPNWRWPRATVLGREVKFHESDVYYYISTGTLAQNWVTYDCSAWVPTTSDKAWFLLKVNCRAATAVGLRRKLDPSQQPGPAEFQHTVQSGVTQIEGWVSLDANQRVELYIAADVLLWELIISGYKVTT